MNEQQDIFVPRKHHADYRDIEAAGVQLKPETYIEWSIAMKLLFLLYSTDLWANNNILYFFLKK